MYKYPADERSAVCIYRLSTQNCHNIVIKSINYVRFHSYTYDTISSKTCTVSKFVVRVSFNVLIRALKR